MHMDTPTTDATIDTPASHARLFILVVVIIVALATASFFLIMRSRRTEPPPKATSPTPMALLAASNAVGS
jgi:hypothetical protein